MEADRQKFKIRRWLLASSRFFQFPSERLCGRPLPFACPIRMPTRSTKLPLHNGSCWWKGCSPHGRGQEEDRIDDVVVQRLVL